MEQEGGYLDWLSRAYGYSRAGDRLLISTGHGVLTYQSSPVLDQTHELQDVKWYLVSVGNLTAVPGGTATTTFNSNGNTVSGNTGCNDFNGSYSTRPGNALTISGFSNTLAACPSEDLARQEEALLSFLPSAVTYLVEGNQMQIQTTDGSVINYTSIPPVQPVPPTAVISGPQGADIGQTVTFDGSGSVAGSTPIVHYEWDMGDGAVLTGPTIQYTYNTASSYDVRLRVVDQAGLTGEATQGVQIYPVVEVFPPTAAIEGPSAAFVGEQVTFSAGNSQQGTAEITGYQWRSGDGNNTGSIPENSFTTIYNLPGTYYPEVTVTDASGLSDSASMAILINANLEGTDWILDGASIGGTSISLVFRNGTLSGFAGCNSYNAEYVTTMAAGTSNSIQISPISSGQAFCDEPIMNQEQAYLTNLQTATSYLISGNSLTLTLVDGSQLVYYAAVATPAAGPVATQ
jgi:heat shock protein HslJ